MFQKICNYLSILSTVLVLGILGGGFFTYKYLTSEQFKAKMMNQVLENVQGLMPDVLDNAIPDFTTPAISLPKNKVHLQESIHLHENVQELQEQVEEVEEEVIA